MDKAFTAHPDLKMLFICSPGNPTGTCIPLAAIRRIAENEKFKGVIVVDEAYIDFAESGSSAGSLVNEFANICVTQTFSKSFGLAAIRWVCWLLCTLKADWGTSSLLHLSFRSSPTPKRLTMSPIRPPRLVSKQCPKGG